MPTRISFLLIIALSGSFSACTAKSSLEAVEQNEHADQREGAMVKVVGCVIGQKSSSAGVAPGQTVLRFGIGSCEQGRVVPVVGMADEKTLENAVQIAAKVMSCALQGECSYRLDQRLLPSLAPTRLISARRVGTGTLFTFSSEGQAVVEMLVSDNGDVSAETSSIDPEGA